VEWPHNFVLASPAATAAACFHAASAIYPNAAGFAKATGDAPGGNGNGGFLKFCVKNTGCREALLYSGARGGM